MIDELGDSLAAQRADNTLPLSVPRSPCAWIGSVSCARIASLGGAKSADLTLGHPLQHTNLERCDTTDVELDGGG